jgi:rhamnose transport system ATP-binding protein
VRRLRDRGVAVVFVSHRLEEVTAIADTVTVLRDGRHITTSSAAKLPHGEIVRLMVGRSLEALFPKEEAQIGDVVLKAAALRRRGVFSDVSFELRRGEIVGLAGFVGAGRSEVARSIFGIDRLDGGELWIDGRRFRPRSPRAALRRGLAYLPEDRLEQGLVQPMSISKNASMAVLPALTPIGLLMPWRERKLARRFMEQLRIKATSPSQVVRSLSGGNQQKVVLAKWLAAEPRILLLDEPAGGLDERETDRLREVLSELGRRDGLGILLVEHDLPLVMELCERVAVMDFGRVIAQGTPDAVRRDPAVQSAYFGEQAGEVSRAGGARG